MLHVGNLTRYLNVLDTGLLKVHNRNVGEDHLTEIFAHYGTISKVDLAVDKRVMLSKVHECKLPSAISAVFRVMLMFITIPARTLKKHSCTWTEYVGQKCQVW